MVAFFPRVINYAQLEIAFHAAIYLPYNADANQRGNGPEMKTKKRLFRVWLSILFGNPLFSSVGLAFLIWLVLLLLYVSLYDYKNWRVIIMDINIIYGSLCGGFFVRKFLN